MVKAMDSNSVAERTAAIQTLFKSALLTRSNTHIKQILISLQYATSSINSFDHLVTYFFSYKRQKIKNENIDMRLSILQHLVMTVASNNNLLSVDCLPVWRTLLQDALEAPDAEIRLIGNCFRGNFFSFL